MAIVIRGGCIAAVGRADASEVPPGAEVIDLTGKFVIRGLVDMHNHLGPGEAIPGPPGRGRESSRDTRPYLSQMLALGFTSLVDRAGRSARARRPAPQRR
ncbi:MAG TPA: hypothetical protein PLH72_04855 [Vicinamibacterales bacterium]|nr:hypothetical protein [Vicinamibacterales bacterium]HQZ38348.1 hypothetical protein [Vicinamibacterales bacterium]